MDKDLTVSQLDRQNILNNDLAIAEIQRHISKSCPNTEYTRIRFIKAYSSRLLGGFSFPLGMKLLEQRKG